MTRPCYSSMAFVALVLLLAAAPACVTTAPVPTPEEEGLMQGEGTPPSVETPPLPRRPVPAPDRAALEALERSLGGPVGLRHPARDGGSFFATYPIRPAGEVSSREVRDVYVIPTLDALGLRRVAERLSGPDRGVAMPRPDFEGLARVVEDDYQRRERQLRPRTREMIAAFLSPAGPHPEIDQALMMGEGMTLQQFVAEIERQEIQYPFRQMEGDIPIEHTLVLAVRREGESVSSLRGVVFRDYGITNPGSRMSAGQAIEAGFKALAGYEGMRTGERRQDLEIDPQLVLLPYGDDGTGRTAMRYAWRMILPSRFYGVDGEFLLWVDATSGDVLKLDPLLSDAQARGEVYNRDPSLGTATATFLVDAASGGQYTLQRAGVCNRVDYRGDGFDGMDVAISDSTGGSSATFANFDQAPLNNQAEALCSSGTNKGFQQVNFFATVNRYREQGVALGVFTPFPTSPWSPRVEMRQCEGADPNLDNRNGWLCGVDSDCCEGTNCGTCTAPHCNAWSSMAYGACGGYFAGDCPDSGWLNFSHDNTVVGHELAHNLTARFSCARPNDWCGGPGCSVPVCWGRLHDLADFWADHLESTNCTAGWVSKNNGGTDGSFECATHTEGGGLPRLHELSWPLDPTDPGDHFPEHRSIVRGGYADGQIGAAALWQVRLGMRSKCRPSGMPQFAVRFARAFKNTGFFGSTPPPTDRGVYRFLLDLQTEMLEQWATSGDPGGPPAFRHNGRHTTNKLTSGFARGGLFLVPPVCIDGDPSTSDPGFCPSGDTGADAVIDIDDNDAADDLSIQGVVHRETDFLELGGPAPTFLVWTGPRYRFDDSACLGGPNPGGACTVDVDCACAPGSMGCTDGTCGALEEATATATALCNGEYRVSVSTAETFPAADTVSSGWLPVNTDPTAGGPACFATWTPGGAEWTALQSGGALSLIYYRAETRDGVGGNLRVSTSPGNGLRTVTPPYAVLTADGRSDY